MSELAKQAELSDEIITRTRECVCVCVCGKDAWGVFGSLSQPLSVFKKPWLNRALQTGRMGRRKTIGWIEGCRDEEVMKQISATS